MTRRSKGNAPAIRIHQAIAREIGIAILSGEYAPGHSFAGEIEYAERLRISRTAYREAVRILVAKGLIESRPKAGTRVTPRDRWNLLDPEMLAWAFATEPDPLFVRDLFELRNVIEPAAAAFAAVRRTDRQLATMEQAIAAMKQHSLVSAIGRSADQEFHKAILLASHNQALATLASSVGAAVSWTTTFKQRTRGFPRDPLPDHIRVHDAIVAGDADAARDAMGDLVGFALIDMGFDLPR